MPAQPGVTRAWVFPLNRGPGTVDGAFVMDGRANTIPQPADVAAVQSAINLLRPVTAHCQVFAPAGVPFAVTLAALSPITPATHAEFAEDILRAVVFAPLSEAEPRASWTETAFPDTANVPWNSIVDLRRSGFLKAFRAKYAELSVSENAGELMFRYYETLEKLADQIKPNIKTEAVKAALGNLPFLPVNPVALAAGAHDIYKAHRVAKEFGWAFFLRDLRKAQK
ncbi:MAG TPA: baseplate J/gp47 family protein [Acetobacteraceae bacterium]|nr:baseplate J/gp47 family protein [Acetobacteraceae bacterium]